MLVEATEKTPGERLKFILLLQEYEFQSFSRGILQEFCVLPPPLKREERILAVHTALIEITNLSFHINLLLKY